MAIEYKYLEALYAATTFGHDEPDIIFTNGVRLKILHKMYGPATEPKDIDGNIIHDGLVYAVTKEAYIPVDDDGHRVKVI